MESLQIKNQQWVTLSYDMGLPKRISFLILSSVLILSVGFGGGWAYRMIRSSWFVVQRIEVAEIKNNNLTNKKIDEQKILQLIAVPLGKISLFEVDLKTIENRLLSQDSICKVTFKKKLFHTLFVEVTLRSPKAVIQTGKGGLAYVDTEGKIFGVVNLLHHPDLPLLFGLSNQGPERIKEALELLARWEHSPLSRISLVSSVNWELDRGFRVLAAYSLGPTNQARTMIDLGQEVDDSLDVKFSRLERVIRYLNSNSIAVHQVWVDVGKKVVVKTVQGS